MILNKQTLCAVCLAVLPQISNADIIDFDFTGRLSVGDPGLGLISNQPIAASFSYDTVSGIGNSSLSITTDQLFFGFPMTFHDISMNRIDGSNLIDTISSYTKLPVLLDPVISLLFNIKLPLAARLKFKASVEEDTFNFTPVLE